MKNIQIIDGAVNSIFEVYAVPDEIFEIIFPNETDIAFLDEAIERLKSLIVDYDEIKIWQKIYGNRIDKKTCQGIHGTLHLTGSNVNQKCFPTRCESQMKVALNSKSSRGRN